MKKSLLSMFALATMLLATGCSQDEELVNVNSDYVEASFTLDLSEGAQSRTLGEGTLVNQLYYGVFQGETPVPVNADAAINDDFVADYVGEEVVTDGTATVKVRLVKGQTYNFVFWAQVKDNTHYTIDQSNLKLITVNYGSNANDETRDAFFACEPDYKVESHFTKTVYLKRPFAQINVGTTKADFEAAKILLGESPVTQSKMVVKNVPTTLNLLDGTVDNPTEATFLMAGFPKDAQAAANEYDILEVQDVEYAHLAMNYVLSDVKGKQEVVEAVIEMGDGTNSINTFTVSQLPIHRNYRTNIIGNILTTNGEFEVIVDAEFEGDEIRELWDGESTKEVTPIEENGVQVYQIATAEELAWIAQQVNSGTNTFKNQIVRLVADIYLNNQPWTPIGLGDGGGLNADQSSGKVFQGTFEGERFTIYDLNIVAVSSRSLTSGSNTPAGLFGILNGTAKEFTIEGAVVKHVASSGQFGIAVVAGTIFNKGNVEDVHVKDAAVEGNHYVGGIAGYVFGNIKNCTVENVKLTATPDNLTGEYDNGDKVGGIAGCFSADSGAGNYELSGNSVTDVTITGYRDLGGVAGAADAKYIKANTVTEVVVTVDRTDEEKNYDSTEPTNAGAVVGSYLNSSSEADLTSNGNTSTGTTVVGNTESTSAVVTTQAEFTAAINNGATEIAVAGEIALSSVSGKELTIVGIGEDAAIDRSAAIRMNGSTLNFKNITIKGTSENYKGFQHIAEEYYTDCTIDNQIFLYGKAHFVNCTFNQTSADAYNVWTYGSSEVTFENCTFNSAGKSVLVYNEGACGTNATFIDCTFKASQPVEGKAAIEIDGCLLKNTDMHVITIDNATVTGFGKGSVSGNSLWNDKKAVKIGGEANTPAGRSIINVEGNVYAYADIPEVLAKALTMDAKTIEAKVIENIDLPITSLGQQTGGSGEYKLGGASTESINIDLNENKLNITTTYWSAIGAKNDNATFSIKNGTMTSTGNSAGTWNAWDLRFSNCNYVFEKVSFEKAVALDNVGKSTLMKDVTITDTHNDDTYGLWITAEGQTVTLENCEINMTPAADGRGIKIDEQYVDDATKAKVTLNVKNVAFKTEEKAAVLVKSAAGADITLNSVNIAEVAADTEYAVWVDEGAAAYADLVRVTGGKVKIEGQVADGVTEKDGVYSISNANGMFWFANEVNVNKQSFSGKTVKLVADIDLQNRDWEPIGQTGATEFRGTFDGQNCTIKNLNIDKTAATDEHTSSGLFGWAESNVTIKDVKVDVAKVEGHHNVAVIVGYTYSGKISNCHVTNAEIVCTHANDDACGDKCGLIAGYTADESRISDCSASNSTVKAGRDAGQLIGLGYNDSVSNCSATNVTVTATGDCTGANVNNAVIGRVM